MLAGVAGCPVGHSRSPLIHNHWLAVHRIDGVYIPLSIAPDDFQTSVRGLAAAGFRGINVTLPHKEVALSIADTADDAARTIGAANTLIFGEDGIEARNTDAYGFTANLRAGQPEFTFSGKAVVLGAGGAARAVIHALCEEGMDSIVVINRTLDRAQAIAERMGNRVVAEDWNHRAIVLDGVSLLVNTTSLGMDGQPPLDIDLTALPREALVTDIVYTPLETNLLAAARRRGNPVLDGLGMLLHQAAPGFAAWFGVMPEVDDTLRQLVLQG